MSDNIVVVTVNYLYCSIACLSKLMHVVLLILIYLLWTGSAEVSVCSTIHLHSELKEMMVKPGAENKKW